jgi:hypothetical protein
VTHAKFKLSDVENMMPWEREIYFAMFLKDIKDRNESRSNG